MLVGDPCWVFSQEEEGWYHGIIANVQEEFIEVREVDTNEIEVVKLPLNRYYIR